MGSITTGSGAARDAIVAAAIGIFGDDGFERPPLSKIAGEAGVSEAELAALFPERDDLIAAVVERIGKTFLDAVVVSEGRGSDLAMTFRRFVNALASGAYPLVGEGGVTTRQLIDACLRSERVRECWAGLVVDCRGRLTEATRRGQEARRVREDADPAEMAEMILVVILGIQALLDLGVDVEPARLLGDVRRLVEAWPEGDP